MQDEPTSPPGGPLRETEPAAGPSPYAVEDRERWRRLLLAKGQEVAKKLEEVLAGKDVRLEDLSLWMTDKEKEPKDKKLRRFLDLLMARLKRVDDPSFGWDSERGAFLPKAVLDDTPWIDLEPRAG